MDGPSYNMTGVLREDKIWLHRDTTNPCTKKGHERNQQEGGCLRVKERSLGRNQTCQHLDLGFLDFRTVRKRISNV